MASKNRIFGLDMLRAVAIIFVLHWHGKEYLGHAFPDYERFVIDGVGIFFVLSGFLIGAILLRTFDRDVLTLKILGRFLARRWFRTLPAYMVILGVLLLGNLLKNGELPQDYGRYFYFSQNLFAPHPDFFPEAWSLAVEEWFYAVVPLGLFVSVRLLGIPLRKALIAWAVLVCLSSILFREYRLHQLDFSDMYQWDVGLRKVVAARMDAIMVGVIGAYWMTYKRALWSRFRLPLLVAGLATMMLDKFLMDSWVFYRNHLHLMIGALGVLCMLPMLSTVEKPRYSLLKIFSFISAISYSLYLVNFSLVHKLIRAMTGLLAGKHIPDMVLYGVYWVLSLSLAWLMYRFIEQPFLRLRDRVVGLDHEPAAPPPVQRPAVRRPAMAAAHGAAGMPRVAGARLPEGTTARAAQPSQEPATSPR